MVHIPWYATGFRGDELEAALAEIAPVALRFGASHYDVFRMRDDKYRFLQTATFEDPLDFDRYWYGERFAAWRAVNSSHYQVPVLYGWADRLCEGSAAVEAVTGGGAAAAAE
jgi:hypothetical protein